MKQEWKKKPVRLTASALITVLLAGSAAPPAAFADPFVFVDEDAGEAVWESVDEDEAAGKKASANEIWKEMDGEKASAGEIWKEADGEKASASELEKDMAGGKASASEALRETAESESDAEDDTGDEISEEELLSAVPSVAMLSAQSLSSLGDLWDDWDADFSFLDGSQGLGTKEKPYQIKTKSQLMGLSQLAVMGMKVEPGEGREEIIGSYEGAYFKLMSNLDLGGMDWNPIGFYKDSSELSGEVETPFCGHFDGNGKTISNFRISQSGWKSAGFFGALENASVERLNLKPGKTVTGKTQVGILAGTAVNSRITECSVEGHITASGTAGGIVGTAEGASRSDSVIENCTARVTIAVNGASELFAGGIAGKAAGTSIVDCRTETGDNSTARIQGTGAVVGGITGFQNDTDIYNSFVSGTIGGAGTQTAGGITGLYASGNLKVARFEGTIGQSGTGSAGHRGTFIGHREAGDWFIYGDDVAYLFADTEAKIVSNVCGSTIPDDNEYTYGASVGYSHSGDLFYSLVQGGVSKQVTDQYYYEVLEEGILEIMDEDNGGADAEALGYELDHVAPNDAGRPVRGYLVTIPQIDTVSGGMNYYDVAVLEARGNNTYYRTMDKDHRGAVEAGKTVTVTTSPKQTEDARFQMDGVPTYTENGQQKETAYISGGEYTFTMPSENTEVNAVYEKVAVKVSVVPAEYRFSVVEERTGDRKQPVKTTKVFNQDGRLIATYINGALAQGTVVQPVTLEAVVDKNNDVADASVKWSVDDPELLLLLSNTDEDNEGYTKQSASLQLNLNAGFFTDTIRQLEKEQAAKNYQYPIPDTVYGAGHQNGGVAILTAATRPSSSFEEKPCTANAKISVTCQVKDKTYVAAESAVLNKEKLTFTVMRKLSGNRLSPAETITVTEPQSLTAGFTPAFFDSKEVRWTVDDPAVLTVSGEGKEALVSAGKDAKWIRDLMAADDGIRASDKTAVLKGSGTRTAKITVLAEDMLGNRRTADCEAEIRFVTKDETWYTGSSSGSKRGSGSSSGTGSGSSSGVSPTGGIGPAGNGPAAGSSAPAGSVTGTWVNTADGRWSFTSGGRTYHEEWAYIHNPYAGEGQNSADWFRFDGDGFMVTGWFTDTDGRQYYLWPVSDGTKGHMVTGWQWIAGEDGQSRRYYFNTEADGTKGCLLSKDESAVPAQLPETAGNEIEVFLESFDWEHASDREKAEQVYLRIANGYSGNTYGVPAEDAVFPVLETGVGLCRNFAEEYAMLAGLVGLRCVTYLPSANHEACLLQMDGRWYALDPTSGAPFSSNLTLKQVDFEEEFHRYEKEQEEYQAEWEEWRSKN